MSRDNSTYYNYLDNVLIQSKFKVDMLSRGSSILLKRFPELSYRKKAVDLLVCWLVDTDPYSRLQKGQGDLFNG